MHCVLFCKHLSSSKKADQGDYLTMVTIYNRCHLRLPYRTLSYLLYKTGQDLVVLTSSTVVPTILQASLYQVTQRLPLTTRSQLDYPEFLCLETRVRSSNLNRLRPQTSQET